MGAFGFYDVETVLLESGQPQLVIRNAAARLATAAGVERFHLSLTHTETVAIAIVVAEGRAQ